MYKFCFHYSYSPENREVSCFNSLVTEARPLTSQGHQQCGLFKPELAVPVKMGHKATRSHCALHVLGMKWIDCNFNFITMHIFIPVVKF